jgi:DNA-binding CsgD family transcriptional regulator
VKSQLDAIYYKTNTHRQAELVRLVMGLTSSLRPDTTA